MKPLANLVSREEKLFTSPKRLIGSDLRGQKQLVNHYVPPAILNIDGKKGNGRPQRVSRFCWARGADDGTGDGVRE
jgi:hypothetical protein